MSDSRDRELEAILKLIKLTQEGKVKWESTEPWGELKDTEFRKIEGVYSTEYEDKQIRTYVENIKHDQPTSLAALLNQSVFGAPPPTFPYWTSNPVLELTNQSGASLWRFPHKPAINDLRAAARYQAAGVKDFFDKLLGDEERK